MPRRLSEEEVAGVWERLLPRLEPPDPVTLYDGGYPVGFPDQLSVPSHYLPEGPFLTAIEEAMRSVGDTALFFLASEHMEEDREKGLGWEVSLSELTCETLLEISPGLQCYLYSTADQWAILFHHEGVAYCGGCPLFVRALRRAWEKVGTGA